ncbi:MAG: TatD family hydrolase [Deltaproteobacteria bacterium]|nr:TatD family hydrolase [Deltaproteobacteria bacterium]
MDSHAHIDGPEFDKDRAEMLERARAAGVEEIIVIGAAGTMDTVERAVALAATDTRLHVSVGVHPHDVGKMDDSWWPRLRQLAGSEQVCAVGETGLDYYYDRSPRALQAQRFEEFIELAKAVNKPVICHIRDAHDDAKRILRESGVDQTRVVIHCFTGSADDARDYARMGCYVSFSGIVTFKSADELRRAVAQVPHDRLLIETDCPYLAPVPRRGKRNEPAFMVHTAEIVAQAAGLTVDQLARHTVDNTRRLFALT